MLISGNERDRAGAVDNRGNVGVAVKPAAGFGDIVGDDHVEIFFAQLLGGVGGQIFGLSGKADQHFAVFVLTQLFYDIGIGFQA